MKYYINNDCKHQKVHTENCHLYKKLKGTKEFKDHWLTFNTLDKVIEYCKKTKRIYRYCGLCMPDKIKGIVR